MTIHGKALEEHFLMVPLVFRPFQPFAFSEFFSEKHSPESVNVVGAKLKFSWKLWEDLVIVTAKFIYIAQCLLSSPTKPCRRCTYSNQLASMHINMSALEIQSRFI
jgi:hypothetical protein